MSKLPCSLQNSCQGKNLVYCFTSGTKSALFLLQLRFDYRSDTSLQYNGISFPRQAEEYDYYIIGTPHHTCLPVTRHCPIFPHNTEQACQPRQPNLIHCLQHLGANLVHPWHLPPRKWARIPLSHPTLPQLVGACPLGSEGLQSVPSTPRLHCQSRSTSPHPDLQ